MKNIPRKLLLLVLTLVIGITLVACGNNKDEEAVKKAITETTVQTEVSANFDLPAKSGDVTIVWTVEGNGLVLGTVANDKQPVTVTQTDSDQSATLKATFKLNKASDTKTYPVKVKAKAPVGKTDAEKVADAITKVTVAGEVTANFDLPTKQDEVGITWTVSGNGLALGTAANDKLPVTVTRTDADQEAILTAVFKLGQVSETKTYTVKVVKKDLVAKTDEEIVNEAIASITVATEVDGNFQVPTKIGDVVVTWEASGAGLTLGAIADGMQTVNVTRTDADQQATLKAVFKLRQVTKDKTYNVKVLLEDASEEDIVDGVVAAFVVPEEVKADFTLDVKVDNVNLSFAVTGDGITKGDVTNGKQTFTVTRTDVDQEVTIGVTFKLGEVEVTKTFTVTILKSNIPSDANMDKAYYEGATGNFSNDETANNAELINLDPEKFFVLGTKTSNSIGVNKDGTMRLYSSRNDGNGSELSFFIKDGYSIVGFEFEFLANKAPATNAELKFGAESEDLTGADIVNTNLLKDGISVNGFSLKNTFQAEDGANQIWIKEIKIYYVEGTPESILAGAPTFPEVSDDDKVAEALEDLESRFDVSDIKADKTLTLDKVGKHNVEITWEVTEGSDHIDLETGKVLLPTVSSNLVLVAKLKLNDSHDEVIFTIKLVVVEVPEGSTTYTEDFENSNMPKNYQDGFFKGVNDTEFIYKRSRDEENYGINGKGIMLADNTSYLEFDLLNGFINISFNFKKAFTANGSRKLNLLVNGVVVASTVSFTSDASTQSFEYDQFTPGPVTIRIENTGSQVVVDNLSWTEEEADEDQKKIYDVISSINIPNEILEKTTLALETEVAGVEISWESSDDNIIDSATGLVVIPSERTKVILTATFIYNSKSITKEYNVNVGIEKVEITDILDLYSKAKGELVVVKAIVTGVIGNNAFIEDETAAIYIYGPFNNPIEGLEVGNEVILHGKLDIYENLYQIRDISSVEVLDTNVPLPAQTKVNNLLEIKNNMSKSLVINGLTITSKSSDLSKSFTVYTDFNGESLEVRVNNTIPLFDQFAEMVDGLKIGQQINLKGVFSGIFKTSTQVIITSSEQFEIVEAEVTTAEVANLDELLAALANDVITEITLTANIETDKTIEIKREVVINGGGFSIEMPVPEDRKWVENNAYVLHVYNTVNVYINDIELIGGNAGLFVNGSIVDIKDITLTNHTHGGIEVSKGVGVTRNPELTVEDIVINGLIDDVPVIWLDGTTVNDNWVTVTGILELYELEYTEDNKTQLWFVTELEAVSVSFMVDGELLTKVYVNEEGLVTLPVDPVKEGFKFTGWFNGEVKFEGTEEVTENLVVVAKFEEDIIKTYSATISKSTKTGYKGNITDGLLTFGENDNQLKNSNNGESLISVNYKSNDAETKSIFNNSAGEIRLYGGSGNGGELLFSISEEYEIFSITITSSQNNGYKVNDEQEEAIKDKSKTITIIPSNIVKLQNVSSGTSQVRITTIELNYRLK